MQETDLDFEITFYEKLVEEKPNYIDALIPLAEAYTRKGLYKKGLAIDQRLAKLCRRDPVVHYNLACSYALLGYKKKAVAALKRAFRYGYADLDHLLQDSDLASLHSDPDFQKLIASRKS